MLVFAVVLVRMTAGVGLAYAHFQRVPDFATFVGQRAVPRDAALALLPGGEVLGDAVQFGDWRPEASGLESVEEELHVTMRHGDELLLDALVLLEGQVDPNSLTLRAGRVGSASMQTREGMRALVQVGLVGGGNLETEVPADFGVLVDVILVAGAGADEFRVTSLADEPPPLSGVSVGPGPVRLVLGLLHPPGELPESGLMARTRQVLPRAFGGGPADGGRAERPLSQFETNFDEYSIELHTGFERRFAGTAVLEVEDQRNREYRWNEATW